MVVKAKTGGHVVVQIRNPRSDRYVKIDKTAGKILGSKKTAGPYKGIKIIKSKG